MENQLSKRRNTGQKYLIETMNYLRYIAGQ